jgi:hypothetical protein
VAAAGAILLVIDAKKTLIGYSLALLPVAAAFFGTNYIAHGELVPAYAHRDLGEQLLEFDIAENQDLRNVAPEAISQLRAANVQVSDASVVREARRQGVFELWDVGSQQRFGLVRLTEQGTSVGIFRWGDWYDYPGSYWVSDRKQGVDKGEPDAALYAFHCLVGHHGIFSLTPFWLVSLLGCLSIWRHRETWNIFRDHRLLISAAILATSLVAVGFYLTRPLEDRNYGGVTSGFRWAFWLTLPWMWLAVHGLRRIESRWGRRTVQVLLAASIFSAAIPWANPWSSPWLMQYWEYLGWI